MVALRELPFFSTLAPQEREMLERIATKRTYPAGSVLWKEGDVAGSLRILLRGLVSFRQKQQGGGADALMGSLHDAGDAFGIAALVGEKRAYRYTAVCLEETEVIEIDGSRLLKLCEDHPRMGFTILMRLASTLAERLAAAREQVRSRIRPGLISHG